VAAAVAGQEPAAAIAIGADQERRNVPGPTVEITTVGRGGYIFYRDSGHTINFDWEFALPPSLALIFGTSRQHWDNNYPWASGKQAEIYEHVAEEIVRQRAPGCGFKVDLDTGTVTIMMAAYVKRTKSHKKFVASMVPKPGRGGDSYDIAAIRRMPKRERKELVDLLTSRGEMTWRDVEALAAIGTPEAQAAIDAASQDHLSIETRLAAAEVMIREGRLPDFDTFLARQIRQLNNPANGLQRTLEIAARHPSESVKQALLWASYNSTECAPHCAALLLTLAGAAKEPFDDKVKAMLQKLDLHNSYFDRKAAFDELCTLVRMELDTNPPD
jgi:hypothetical protein